MNPHLQPYLNFTRSQRIGLAALLSLIAIVQLSYCFIDVTPDDSNSARKRNWLALQPKIDSLKKEKRDYKPKIYPFNPNFITDYKGYRLGMSVAEIDRLFAFRKQNKYVNSTQEFQHVTKVSDSLLATISPYFKFPDWVTKKRGFANKEFSAFKKEKIVKIDINRATQEELMKVYGIGPALSERILKQRELLGNFVDMKQMADVWGLSPEVVEKLEQRFFVSGKPEVKKIAINDASLKELAAFPYFRYKIAKSILTYRSMNGKITNTDDLMKIPEFPVDNVKIISLYLEL
ncbi:MAG: helix-hairpin-helix domain-containing protein [Flavobacterium sp.]|uniref:ComEA family DNA-binding protein n=1 Tax=Flavobacterium sp. TaxID=239 RepID=UPI00120B5D9F|nr:helix-hairpin-helix domain-containing protein [Flavobacterium sp.]RZJ63317.1 MAG: helix-hairpin-helix domain-containing protein [Flavobacterium sp.]